MAEPSPKPDLAYSAAESTELLALARAGDARALNALFGRYIPHLTRLVHRRVPGWARGPADSADLVQETLLHTLRNLTSFRPEKRGALLHYLRRALINRVRDHVRNVSRHPTAGDVDDTYSSPMASPLEMTMDQLQRERYLSALARLKPADRAAIVSRIDLGYSYDELRDVLGSPTTQAARLFVRRALLRLADEMHRE